MSAISSVRHLWALRSFDAAARLLSFQKAAQELNLTPSAVSHQIKRLEIELGQTLFVREPRSIRLTEAGEKLQRHTRRGFAELSQGLDAIANKAAQSELRVSAAPAFAARYLTSRVAQFERANPSLRLTLDVSQQLVELKDGKFDAVVRLGYGADPDIHMKVLARLQSALVCAPAIAAKIKSVDDVQALTRITLNQLSHEWDTWYQSMGEKSPKGKSVKSKPIKTKSTKPSSIKPKREFRFTPMLDGIQAAIDGIGVAIAPVIIVEKHLQDGRLVMPFKQTFESKASYLFLCRQGEESSRRIKRLYEWVNQAMQE